MPNVMLTLPNVGGALCSTPQSVGDAQPCSSAAQTRKPLKLPGVPNRSQSLVGAILCGHLEKILLLNKFFFPIVDTCLSCEDIA